MANWDKRYTAAEARLFGDRPNEYLRQVMARSDVAPASALMIGDGDGRNGAWLAAQGLAVTAVDISAVATKQARAHDAAAGVAVERIIADLAEWTPETGHTWDAAFMIYLQCEAEVRRRAANVAAKALSPGGWFAAEGFAPDTTGDGELGPRDGDLLYKRDEMLAALGPLQEIEVLNGRVLLNEGAKHQGTGWVLRLLARRI